jgi:hypothetical protein
VAQEDKNLGGIYGGISADAYLDQGSVFLGYEHTENQMYYAFESNYNFDDLDTMNVSVRAGVELRQNIVAYGILGYGWEVDGKSNQRGKIYGFGTKYIFNDKCSIGAEYVHQYFTRRPSGNVNLRGILRF